MSEGNEEEFTDEEVFQQGEGILIDLEDGTMAIGQYVGIMDFGLVSKNTHRMEKIRDKLSPAFRNDFVVGLWKLTVVELKDMAVDEDIALTGLKRKGDIIAEISDVMLARAEDSLEERTEFVALKRPILSFLPWPRINEVRRLSEYLEEMDLQEFSDSLDMFAGVEVVVPESSQDASKE